MGVSRLAAGVVLAGCLLCSVDSRGQDSREEFAAIHARLERQEAELRTLRERLAASSIEPLPSTKTVSHPTVTEGPMLPVSEGYVVGSDTSMKASWRHGVEIESPHKDFRMHVGGRVQFDGVWLDGSDDAFDVPAPGSGTSGVGDADSVNFRRARLRVDGTLYDVIDYACEYDFVNSTNVNAGLAPASEANVVNVPVPTDVWVTFKELPAVGNLRVGNFKEPIGLEHLTSSRFLDFMERSYLQDAFTGAFNNGFSQGAMIFDWSEERNTTCAIGLFKNAANPYAFNVGDGEYATTGRVTWAPWYDEPSKGRYMFHVGAAASYRDTDNDVIRIRARPSLRNGPGPLNPVMADTGTIPADNQSILAGEAALVYGPWLLQGEYMASHIEDAVAGPISGETLFVQGYYVEALYFLTGEHREYDRKAANFGRVVPHENAYFVRGLGWCGGGAWQVGARYSMLDLRDSGFDGGLVQDVTLGLNWFLNPNMKVQWNYVYTQRDAPGINDHFDGAGMRLAWDF